MAVLARFTATLGSVAFNLGLALVFALSALGAYGLVYNLLAAGRNSRQIKTLPALLGPFFVLIVSNLSGLLHLLRVKGLFWRQDAAGNWFSSFWKWLDIGRFSEAPPGESFPFWWWWQGSRIVQDYDYLWRNKGDVIDEFPFFSFLLGDLHPHVLAMPFAFLGIALALNLLLGSGRGRMRWLGIPLKLSGPAFAFAAVTLGALGFLNTWDFPFYVALFAGAYVLTNWTGGKLADGEPQPAVVLAAKDFFGLGLAIGATGGVLYLPFYLGFSSQAGGLLPNLIYVTRGVHLWVQFAPLLVPLLVLAFVLWRRAGDRADLAFGLKVTGALIGLLLALLALLTALIAGLHVFQGLNPDAGIAANVFLGSLAAPGWREAILEGFRRRLTTPGALLTLATLLTLVFALLRPRRAAPPPNTLTPNLLTPNPLSPASTFTLLLALLGGLLVLGPEFVFLRDFFGYRINTIFKFYFLAWLLWSVAAAYACAWLWQELPRPARRAFQGGMVVLLGLASLYPAMGLWSKTNGFQPGAWRLDGAAHLEQYDPDEAAAMAWLRAAPLGVLAEAVGGSYSAAARMSTHSGQPTVLGWVGHEHQWRGGFEEMGSRESDIKRLYCSPTWPETEAVLRQYGIRYVVIGNLERTTYAAGSPDCETGLSEGKFLRYFEPVFQQGSVTIYESQIVH